MSLATDIRKSVTDTTPVLALVGATDLVVEKVRGARAQAEQVRAELARVDIDVTAIRGTVQHVPVAAVSKSIELAGKAEEAYEDLAARGEALVDRIRRQKATQDLLAQGKFTISRGKAAVTTVRKAAVDTRTAAKATLTSARREAGEVAGETQRAATKSAAKRTATKSAAKRTATTARKRGATAKSTAKSAVTSARKTAEAATKATEAAASKVGD